MWNDNRCVSSRALVGHQLSNRNLILQMVKQQMLYYFSILSWAAAVMVVLLVLLDEFHSRVQVMSASLRLGRWLHAAAAAALHLGAASWDDWRLMVAIAVNLLVASAVLWSARADGWADVVVLHQGMVVANFVVLAVGFLLRWDQLDSDRALQELDASKYRYKSL